MDGDVLQPDLLGGLVAVIYKTNLDVKRGQYVACPLLEA